ncbi:hypothetical protein JW877_09865 [bacterium]|nr:hypothetical protein [bacterium]
MKRSILIILALLVIIGTVFAYDIDTTGMRELYLVELVEYMQARDFVSREELLQLFYEVHHSLQIKNFIIRRQTLLRLNEKIHTYFPLENCQEIIYLKDMLIIRFLEKQEIFIPGTKWQSSLKMSREVVFELKPWEEDQTVLKFEIREGEIILKTTWLLKLSSPDATDLKASFIFYKVDPADCYSIIGLCEELWVPWDSLVVTRTDTGIFIDARDPQYPDKVDMFFKKNVLYYMGTELEIINDSVYIQNGEAIIGDFATPAIVRVFLDSVLAQPPEKVFKNGISKRTTYTFNPEKQEGNFSSGMNLKNINPSD